MTSFLDPAAVQEPSPFPHSNSCISAIENSEGIEINGTYEFLLNSTFYIIVQL